ncbi:inverted formin-2-like [Elysia marginata]|uniref:Inverted formin-2-like n=1 Tax=Elysia marginata TaxID=1093978 RepID=A0AAV4GFP8_9GAST|nr:inverted formin-2-like [Elysia marginata]
MEGVFRRVSNVFHRRGRKKSPDKEDEEEEDLKTGKKEKKIRFSLRHRKKKKHKSGQDAEGVNNASACVDDNVEEPLNTDSQNNSGSAPLKTSDISPQGGPDTNNGNEGQYLSSKDDAGTGEGELITDVTATAATATPTTTSLGSGQPSAGAEEGQELRTAPLQSQSSPLHIAQVHSHSASHESSSRPNTVEPGGTVNGKKHGNESGDVNIAFDDGDDTKGSTGIDREEKQLMGKNYDKYGKIPNDDNSIPMNKDLDLKSSEGVSNGAFHGDESEDRTSAPLIASSKSSSMDSVMSGTSGSSTMESMDRNDNDGDVPKALPSGKKGFRHLLRRKISSNLQNMDLDNSDPEFVISIMAIPTAQTFSSVKRKLRSCSQEWMQGFLDNEGLERLLDCVDTLALKRVTVLSDALVLIECVECIKAVLNSKIGLSLLVEKPEYCRRLIKAMDTNNAMVKKQVVDLLSALCMYSAEGHQLALDALDTFRTMKQMRYRFSLIINELKTCEMTPYKTTLMAFINCILCAIVDLLERTRIRNEFIG